MNAPWILLRYLSRSFAFGAVIALLVLSFIMSLGAVFQMSDLIGRGVPPMAILSILLNGIPAAMVFAVPMSTLVTSLLMYGRLSADGEITAMRASGLSFPQIMAAPLLVCAAATLACFYINGYLAPQCHYTARSTMRSFAALAPMELLEVGRYIDYQGFNLYISDKDDKELKRVRILTQTSTGARREILAERGTVATAPNRSDIHINLSKVTIDPFLDDRPGPGTCGHYSLTITNAISQQRYRPKTADLTLTQLISGQVDEMNSGPDSPLNNPARLRIEFHKRLVLTLSCFSFAFLGIPLGIRSHRKESSIGVAISLILVLNFYLFIIIAEALAKSHRLIPIGLIWMPVVLSMAIGCWLIRRAR